MIEQAVHPRLSICIATYNRARFIGQTLDSVLGQMRPGVELVVVDGASPDNTPEVVALYASRHPELRYFREDDNSGIDRDYDKAVGYAAGDYCWLMTDDDILVPGAVQRVLSEIEGGHDLVVVNAEVWNVDLTERLEARRLPVAADTKYDKASTERFFAQAANYLGFIGGTIIRRDLWLFRDRATYYGSLFVHVGVIFQSPSLDNVKIVAEPLIMIRNGNAMWTSRSFEIWMFKWPELIWSFSAYSDDVKRTLCPQEPWRRFKSLLYHRALGSYSTAEYRKYLAGHARGFALAVAHLAALCPASLANLLVVLYYGSIRRSARVALYDALRSRHAAAASRLAAKVLGVMIR